MTGRPSTYTVETATEICVQIASGRSLAAICRDETMPGISTVYRWLALHEGFRELYARAREDQADTLADEILLIADEAIDPQIGRLRVDARKWVAAKLKPRKYGDKMETTVNAGSGLLQLLAQLSGSATTESGARDSGAVEETGPGAVCH